STLKWHALYWNVSRPQQLVSSILDPTGGDRVGWSTVRWVVFEAAILRWIMRRRHHDAVRQVRFAVAVVNQDRSGDDWRGSDAAVLLNQRLNLIRSQYFERRALRR